MELNKELFNLKQRVEMCNKLKLTKQEKCKLYYENNREKHLNKMKEKYKSCEKQFCECCNKEYIKSKFQVHLQTQKHKMNCCII
jgi:hypothetical protein